MSKIRRTVNASVMRLEMLAIARELYPNTDDATLHERFNELRFGVSHLELTLEIDTETGSSKIVAVNDLEVVQSPERAPLPSTVAELFRL